MHRIAEGRAASIRNVLDGRVRLGFDGNETELVALCGSSLHEALAIAKQGEHESLGRGARARRLCTGCAA